MPIELYPFALVHSVTGKMLSQVGHLILEQLATAISLFFFLGIHWGSVTHQMKKKGKRKGETCFSCEKWKHINPCLSYSAQNYVFIFINNSTSSSQKGVMSKWIVGGLELHHTGFFQEPFSQGCRTPWTSGGHGHTWVPNLCCCAAWSTSLISGELTLCESKLLELITAIPDRAW